MKKDFNRVTALYERLSKDDDLQGESNSISNPKEFLANFARTNSFTNLKHYKDDGYTGRNFNRPGFKEMLRAGAIEDEEDTRSFIREKLEMYKQKVKTQKNRKIYGQRNSKIKR